MNTGRIRTKATMNKIKVEMGAVPETMLQTMYARARESQKPDAVIHDEKAIEIVA